MAADVTDKGEDAVGLASATGYRRRRARRDAPGIDGFETCRPSAVGGGLAPVLMLTRATRSGPGRGARRGRRRLPDQAVLVRRAAGPARGLVRRGAGGAASVLRVGDLRSTRPRARPGAARPRSSSRRRSSRCSRPSCAGQVRCSPASAARARLGLPVREPLQRGGRVRGLLREKIDRPFGVERIETVRGAGYRLREEGGPRDGSRSSCGRARVRRDHGGGPGRRRPLRAPSPRCELDSRSIDRACGTRGEISGALDQAWRSGPGAAGRTS